MSSNKGLEATFDTVVANYDKMRPGYVPELFEAVFNYAAIDENSKALEVGSGSGQATKPVLDKGCELISVEYGENFSKILKEKFKDYPKFSVITGKFEDTQLPADTFDLIFSATAFHWVPEEIGYKKVFEILKPGGAFARFANRPRNCKDAPELAGDIEALYNEYYNPQHNIKPGTQKWFTEDDAKAISLIPEKYGFTDIRLQLFYRERVFTAHEYTALLGTYSDHIAIEEKIRNEFFAKIEDAINRHGGRITISDTMDLELARKPYQA
ncbi:MAG: class I SAM-dependent methyltransferase [Saccharofermentans sp.]|nr:class I SAM-dependent methyltransferase [Saccharofermentans sp.]